MWFDEMWGRVSVIAGLSNVGGRVWELVWVGYVCTVAGVCMHEFLYVRGGCWHGYLMPLWGGC